MQPHDGGEQAAVAQRRARAIQLKNTGLSYYQVAERLGREYDYYLNARGEPSSAAAAVDISRALKIQRAELNQSLEEMIQLADARYDDMRRVVLQIMARPHYVVQSGEIIRGLDGEPLRDDGPVLAAIDRWLKIEERWAKMHGVDATKELRIALERRTDLEAGAVTEAILAGFDVIEQSAEDRMRALEAAQSRLNAIDGEVVSES